jgi:RNA polymerase sigma factor (TIGR02999 family)
MNTITQLLRKSAEGNSEALEELIPLVYDQLRSIAGSHLASENPNVPFRATELVHEAYLRLAGSEISFTDRVHFFALASRLIRRILVDHAKARGRLKRGGEAIQIPLEHAIVIAPGQSETVIALNDALARLEELDARKARVVELVFFGGMEQDMVAEALNISPATVRRDLRFAKAWIANEMSSTATA